MKTCIKCFVLVTVLGVVPFTTTTIAQTAKTNRIMLVAATPGNSKVGPAFPSRIYTVKEGKLSLFRAITSETIGIAGVINSDKALYFIPGSNSPTKIEVIEKSSPEKTTSLYIDSKGIAFSSATTLIDSGQQEKLIIPMITKIDHPSLADILFLPARTSPEMSVAFPSWSDFEHPFWTQSANAPFTWELPLIARNSDRLVLEFAGHDVANLAPRVPDIGTLSRELQFVVGSSSDYVVAEPIYTGSDAKRIRAAKNSNSAIFDRSRNRWSIVSIEGNASSAKLMGDWICWTVGQSGVAEVSPGRDKERTQGTRMLPSVADAYATPDDGSYVYRPGILLLEDPKDDRHFRIVTGQEDSEVIYVDQTTVIYRVNDTIFEAILGNNGSVGSTTKLVRDEDVPEIHWGFFAP